MGRWLKIRFRIKAAENRRDDDLTAVMALRQAVAIFMLMIAFAQLVLKMVEMARRR